MSECEILVVDDDADLSAAMVDVAESLGYKALQAANGREGLEIIDKIRPSLVLVDLFMPVMGGIEFLRQLRRRPDGNQIPCVIMTGANDQMVGVKEDLVVLYKPFDLDLFADVLKQHCGPRPAS